MLLAFFTLQVFSVYAFWIFAASRASGPSLAKGVALTLGLWLSVTFGLAYSGWLKFGPLPPPVVLLVILATSFTGWLSGRPIATSVVRRLDIQFLVGFQVFRAAVEIFLWLGHAQGFVPIQMTWEGRNWDILTGLSAPCLALLAARHKAPKMLILLWNFAGLGLLLNIVVVALLSMPTPVRQFLNEPANRFVAEAPYAWLPLFLVPSALLGHLLVFRWLQDQKSEAIR